GTNAHVILEEPPAEDRARAQSEPRPPAAVPVAVSARSEEALREQADRLRAHVTEHPDVSVLDLGFSSLTARAQLERRAVVVASDRAELLAGLGALAASEPAAHVLQGSATGGKPVFVFPGQGAQWAGMAVGLLES
ncbi:ketoacyl-synthetase C-terminal extension domain-containing protein, partial [Streptomyces sp. B1866]|uniref:CurL C-terminal domain-containing protein n=1 Tax=Streptomyces sp. B1866 TaxID=3075431 RepID=UPI0028923794